MHSSTWKQFERDAATFLGGQRYPANQGGPIDIEGPMAIGQCKKKTTMSHCALAKEVAAIDQLANPKGKLGAVLHAVPRQKGVPPVKMITMSWEMFDQWFSLQTSTAYRSLIEEESDV